MVYPIKPWRDARITVSFLDKDYNRFRVLSGLTPAEHPGIDINIGPPGDWDKGYPVRSIYNGIVVSAASHKVWGNVVLIHHPGLNVWSQYAHLQHVSVYNGYEVVEGEDIGSIGKGDPVRPFAAHLHFEIRQKKLPADYWPGVNKTEIASWYIDPEHVFAKFNAGDSPRR